jgi:hypothetical protein
MLWFCNSAFIYSRGFYGYFSFASYIHLVACMDLGGFGRLRLPHVRSLWGVQLQRLQIPRRHYLSMS